MFCLHIFTPALAQKAPAPTGSEEVDEEEDEEEFNEE